MVAVEKNEAPGLLKAAREMNQEAIVKIFDLYSSALFNYVDRLCHDPVAADQVVGDVFVKLLEQLSAGNGPRTNLRSYLYETAYHIVIDESRDSQHNAPLEAGIDKFGGDGYNSVRSRVEERIMMESVISAMKTELTDDQRHVIILRFMEDFSIRETAAIMGKDINNVKVLQNRGIARIRKALGLTGKAEGKIEDQFLAVAGLSRVR